MDAEPLSIATPLPPPPPGGSTRVRLGSQELVLEAVRGGHSLLWLDGQNSRRYALGLPAGGTLALELRAPRHPLHVACRETLALAPGARLRGYLQVPLVPALVFRGRDGGTGTLLELAPRDLQAEWDEHDGARFRCVSPLHVRFPMRNGEPRAVVPVRLYNAAASPCSPAFVPFALADGDLVPLRAALVVRPRRLSWDGARWQAVAARAEVLS